MTRKDAPKRDRHTSHVKVKGDRGRQRREGYGGMGAAGNWRDDLAPEVPLDPRDPTYDSEDERDPHVFYRDNEGQIDRSHIFEDVLEDRQAAAATLHGFKTSVRRLLGEFFREHDVGELIEQVKLLEAKPHFMPYLIREALSLSFDKKPHERAPLPKLFEALFDQEVVSRKQVMEGFTRVAENLPDIVIDCPGAKNVLEAQVEECRLIGLIPDFEESELLRLLNVETDPEKYQELKKDIRSIFSEFFKEHSLEDCQTAIMEFKHPIYHPEVVKLGIQSSLDFSGRERELMSQLLASEKPGSDVGEPFFSAEHVCMGFTKLLMSVSDMYTDCHDVMRILSSFIARAVVDDVIPPAFLRDLDGLADGDLGMAVMQNAAYMYDAPRAGSRLAAIWGPGARNTPELKAQLRQSITDYVQGGPIESVLQDIADARAPSFMYQVVYLAFDSAMEGGDPAVENAVKLVQRLLHDRVASEYQVYQGLQRIESKLDKKSKDVPNAPELYKIFRKPFVAVCEQQAKAVESAASAAAQQGAAAKS